MTNSSVPLIALLFIYSCNAYCDETETDDLSIPMPVFASELDKDQQTAESGETSFLWDGDNPEDVLVFYNDFFISRGWSDPMAYIEFNLKGWDSITAGISESNLPQVSYRKTWEKSDTQSIASLELTTNANNNDRFSNTASVLIKQKASKTVSAVGWKGNVELGLNKTYGNTESENYKTGIAISREALVWAQDYRLGLLKSSSNGVDFIESSNARAIVRRSLNDQSYIVGSLNYLDDGFDGFTEQYSASLGYGYNIIDTVPVHWGVSAGIGYRSTSELKTFADGSEVKGKNLNSATLVVTSDLKNQLTSNTQLVDVFRAEVGLENSYIENDLALIVSMNNRYAIKAGVLVRHNTSPGLGADKTDTITSMSFLYEFGH